MGAPKGNQFWKARSKHGRDKIFQTPDILWEACTEYFEWVEENPLWENKPFNFQGVPVENPIAKMRAMTITSLCRFLDVDFVTWKDYHANKDFTHVTTRVEDIIRDQKFAGAAADLLNANIIARDLGLTDKKEIKAEVNDYANLEGDELNRKIAEMQQKLAKSQED